MGSSSPSPLLIAIFGPTSSGKTSLSVQLGHRIRRHFGQEPVVISADSRQVYKYMDIGTSKTTAGEMGGIRHEMIDVVEPIRRLDLEDYVEAAREHIEKTFAAGGIPFVVGGTGVYLKALLEGWGVEQTGGLRESLRKDFPRNMAQDAHAMLRRLDRGAAAKVHPNNYEGVINALVSVMSKENEQQGRQGPRMRHLVLGLNPPPRLLDDKVARTYDEQVRRGLFAEVCDLATRYNLDDEMRRKGKDSKNQVLHTHGYREYFEVATERRKSVAELSTAELSEVRNRVVEHIRVYTRHQKAWFGKLPDVRMIKSGDQAFAEAARAIKNQSS